ncbi:GGDEF domain-containing protein [Blautia massiliensis (ex Durand et al. 2017)]|uniref:GGDEF domain-containing protein n=1 Tax=Blautia massiliensis (ex Durand et al. 2017) TaxID=1737424 RepID=UPI0022E02A45|nr:GGDEF domain-containing protein [Blautia massiliensis (ex Durand et al. 2017)]
MDMNLSFSVLTANIISILLIGTLYLANRQKAEYDRDMRLLQQMMVTIGIANISDCCVYYLAGSSNIVIKVLVFLSGSWIFLGNVMIGYLWAKFIMVHMNIPFSDIRRKIYRTIGLISIVLLVINIFYPLVFSVSEGRYQRESAYIIFLIFAVFYIWDSLYLYVKRVKKNGSLKLFPVHIFLIPVIFGVVIQVFFVEIAITWTSIAISVAGIMTALKNEIIFTDCLTGLYNRVYLEFLHKRACNKKNCWISGIMIDLNGFKQINDNYGHSEGDLALCIFADLLRKSFSEYGVVTRYAGDEFVIMLNTTDEQLIQKIIKSAKKNFVTENEKNDKPYQLSASMGYAITNLSNETIDDFMNRIDEQMYQDKLKYYEHNDRRNSK